MSATTPPSWPVLAFRAFSAMLLTGILSAFLMAVGTTVVLSVMSQDRSTPSIAALSGFTAIVWFFGSFAATGCAVVLGLLVEWPKARWQAKRRTGGFGVHLLISLAAAETLLLGWTTVSVVVRQEPTRDLANTLLFVAAAAAVGAACSAALWWKLIVLPMRRSAQSELAEA